MSEIINKERIAELEALASEHLNDRDFFYYHDWDDLIECDESMTDEELDYLRDNYVVEVTLRRKELT